MKFRTALLLISICSSYNLSSMEGNQKNNAGTVKPTAHLVCHFIETQQNIDLIKTTLYSLQNQKKSISEREFLMIIDSAIEANCNKIVEFLIKITSGKFVNSYFDYGMTPLMNACINPPCKESQTRENRIAIIKILLNNNAYKALTSKNNHPMTAAQYAKCNEFNEALKIIHKHRYTN